MNRPVPLLALMLAVMPVYEAASQEPRVSTDSVTIEPYTGPPIYLPEDEPPPPPREVRSRTLNEKYPETEQTRFERRVQQMSDDTVRSDGAFKEYYPDGTLYLSGRYDAGRPSGEWVYHHPNGEVAKSVSYQEGQPNGEVRVTNPEGVVVAVRNYAAGRRDGEWVTYSGDGQQKLAESRYEGGLANGVFRTWWPNGELRAENPFTAGKRDGLAREWNRMGEKRAEVNFVEGVRDGKATVWQRDGSIIEQTYEDGKLVERRKSKAG